MKTWLLKPAAIVAVLVLTTASIDAQQPQPNPTPRNSIRVVSYSGDLAALLSALAPSYNVTIALETDPQQPSSQVIIEVKDGTIRDVLDAIVRNRPQYSWAESDGVFEVFPVAGRAQFLETRISSFQISNTSWFEASNILLALPEVQESMAALRLSRREAAGTKRGQLGELFSVDLKNLTLRQALNEMARKSGHNFWRYSQNGGHEKSFAIEN
jgi:hypothetical protein